MLCSDKLASMTYESQILRHEILLLQFVRHQDANETIALIGRWVGDPIQCVGVEVY
jgi:hypothetical protein